MSTSGSSVWHATPLHYLPYLLRSGAILSAAGLAAEQLPIEPRHSAIARRQRLGLADWVHLSLEPNTPLLRDKIAKGYPHALIEFDRATILSLPGTALLRFNTKRWAHRDDFVPVRDPQTKAELLAAHGAGRFPSLEVLATPPLSLALAIRLHFASKKEASLLQLLTTALSIITPPLPTSPDLFPAPNPMMHFDAVTDYIHACLNAGAVLPPPALPFD